MPALSLSEGRVLKGRFRFSRSQALEAAGAARTAAPGLGPGRGVARSGGPCSTHLPAWLGSGGPMGEQDAVWQGVKSPTEKEPLEVQVLLRLLDT